MALTNIFGLLGGLGLFLFGMTLMSQGLETAAGSRLKQILGRCLSRCLDSIFFRNHGYGHWVR